MCACRLVVGARNVFVLLYSELDRRLEAELVQPFIHFWHKRPTHQQKRPTHRRLETERDMGHEQLRDLLIGNREAKETYQ